jgi:translation elongation factor EF-1beta
MIVATDEEGVADRVENALGSISGIQSVESVETTLL